MVICCLHGTHLMIHNPIFWKPLEKQNPLYVNLQVLYCVLILKKILEIRVIRRMLLRLYFRNRLQIRVVEDRIECCQNVLAECEVLSLSDFKSLHTDWNRIILLYFCIVDNPIPCQRAKIIMHKHFFAFYNF